MLRDHKRDWISLGPYVSKSAEEDARRLRCEQHSTGRAAEETANQLSLEDNFVQLMAICRTIA